MGGSDIAWHKAIFCPYVRSDGSPCYDEMRGSPWIDCPICGGEGAVYAEPVIVKGIYTDKSDEFIPDGSGGFTRNIKSLSLPMGLDIKLLKPRHTAEATRRWLRDKFQLLGLYCNPDGSREVLETFYLDDDVVHPTINSGKIYQIVAVRSNY